MEAGEGIKGEVGRGGRRWREDQQREHDRWLVCVLADGENSSRRRISVTIDGCKIDLLDFGAHSHVITWVQFWPFLDFSCFFADDC